MDLKRFVEAQKDVYDIALKEVKNGRKTSHWMWYIFPQLSGLGRTSMANYYGISDLEEAKSYLADEVLGSRLREISSEVLKLEETNPEMIFGEIDAMKLRSSMTLFEMAGNTEDDLVFGKVLDKYYNGERDRLTISMCQERKMPVKVIK